MRTVVHAWAEPSSRGTTTYECLLYSDGGFSCNCPGWTFKKKGEERACKHTRSHAYEANAILSGNAKAIGAVGSKLAVEPWGYIPPKPPVFKKQGKSKVKEVPPQLQKIAERGRAISFIDETLEEA